MLSPGGGLFRTAQLAVGGLRPRQLPRVAPMMDNQVEEEHQNQHASERADDRGARGEVQPYGKIDAQRGYQRAHGPADRQARPDAVGEEHGSHRGHNQVAEHHQHPGDAHGPRHHEAERSVEEKIPEADGESLGFGGLRVGGDQQKILAEDVVENPDDGIERRRAPHYILGNRQDVSDEHVFQVLGFAGGLAHDQDGGSGGYGVGDPDEGFLRNVRAPRARHREDARAEKGERKADPVGTGPVRVHAYEYAHRGAERSDLRQRQVHENHTALDNMHAEIRMDSGNDQAGQKRPLEKFQNFHLSSSNFQVPTRYRAAEKAFTRRFTS